MKYRIRFNKTRGMTGRGSVDHMWSVDEEGKEYLFKNFELQVPSAGGKKADNDEGTLVCHGVMSIDRGTSTAIIKAEQCTSIPNLSAVPEAELSNETPTAGR